MVESDEPFVTFVASVFALVLRVCESVFFCGCCCCIHVPPTQTVSHPIERHFPFPIIARPDPCFALQENAFCFLFRGESEREREWVSGNQKRLLYWRGKADGALVLRTTQCKPGQLDSANAFTSLHPLDAIALIRDRVRGKARERQGD